MNHAKMHVDRERSEIRIDFDNSKGDNDMILTSEKGEKQRYHLSHLIWKSKSEHRVSKTVYDAEL